MLARETHADDTNYAVVGGENCILVSAGPVTVDLIGRQMCLEALEKKGIGTAAVQALSNGWLKTGAELGLGAAELSEVDLQELALA